MSTGQYNNNKPIKPNKNRGIRPAKVLREKVPGAVIAIYIMMAVLVLAICALIFVITLRNTGWNGENQRDSSSGVILSNSGESDDPLASSNDSGSGSGDISDSSDYWVIDSNSGDISDSWSDTISSSDDPQSGDTSTIVNFEVLPTDYDPEFFEDDLFIGDSIFTGLHLYGYLPAWNVAAAVGYTPYKAIHSTFDKDYPGSASDYAAEFQPDRIYIMLGSNAIGSTANYDLLVSQYEELLNSLRLNCPNIPICVISIPPVTADTSYTDIKNENIDIVNKKLKTMTSSAGFDYLNLNAMLKGADNYFMKEYAEMDGLHFKGSTYKVLLSALQRKYAVSGGE